MKAQTPAFRGMSRSRWGDGRPDNPAPMNSLQQRLARIPEGAAVLFMIQVFATLGFAVLQSTLVLYATRRLGFSNEQAALMMGLFGAFNYGLHLFGGYLGGRFLKIGRAHV